MKRLVLGSLALLLASALVAAEGEKPAPPLGAKADKLVAEALPVCSEATTLSRVGLLHKLPGDMLGAVVRVASKHTSCEGQWVAITSTEGGFYIGVPWFLDDVAGQKSLEDKLKAFTLNNMHEAFEPVIDNQTKTREGLYRVVLKQIVEGGKLPLEGEIDPTGSVFFIGHFYPLAMTDFRAERLKSFEPFLAVAPTTGAAKPEVTVIEFSDFECPSCKHAAGYLKPIMTAHGDKVRYIRYDTPLATIHPWALAAAVAGRAIWRQKPDLFWQYKEQVYDNQEKLTAFAIDDFGRNFAADHDLDMKKYDADVNSPTLRADILNGVGLAFSNDVRATPTYMINGAIVDAGAEGKSLIDYVDGLLKK